MCTIVVMRSFFRHSVVTEIKKGGQLQIIIKSELNYYNSLQICFERQTKNPSSALFLSNFLHLKNHIVQTYILACSIPRKNNSGV